MDLSIRRTEHGDRTIVRMGGEIDVYTASLVRESLEDQLGQGRIHLILDLSDVTFLDSTGLGVLVGRLKRARALGGSLRLVASDERVLRVFAITGLDKIFEIHADLDTALRVADEPAVDSADGAVATGPEEPRAN
ncbi:MAG: STAS domain-containing protein [Dermatophilaceae bacterium]